MLTVPIIAKATLRAAEIHEKSYSGVGAPSISIDDAAIAACAELNIDPKLARLLSLALSGWWNDVTMWAEDQP